MGRFGWEEGKNNAWEGRIGNKGNKGERKLGKSVTMDLVLTPITRG